MTETRHSDELVRIAEKLAGILATIQQLSIYDAGMIQNRLSAPPANDWDRAERLATARQQMRLRELRINLFDNDLVGEFAWNMLLFCFAERMAGSMPTVSAVCAASYAPATTASRHLQALVDAGYLVRTPDPHDARRGYVELSMMAEQHMHSYLDAVKAMSAYTPAPDRPLDTGSRNVSGSLLLERAF